MQRSPNLHVPNNPNPSTLNYCYTIQPIPVPLKPSSRHSIQVSLPDHQQTFKLLVSPLPPPSNLFPLPCPARSGTACDFNHPISHVDCATGASDLGCCCGIDIRGARRSQQSLFLIFVQGGNGIRAGRCEKARLGEPHQAQVPFWHASGLIGGVVTTATTLHN